MVNYEQLLSMWPTMSNYCPYGQLWATIVHVANYEQLLSKGIFVLLYLFKPYVHLRNPDFIFNFL